ncbi:hypothetical protein PLESTB_001336900 [Pleodorina starrii]|uniref:C3H1-type domain-containing protein n=1 Tax=Pleodorina starrii TaxID=330485 RepID=A0A9W6BTN1_9CHLO|nr:hypothetical protein PLESTB_001336900 [Pleodorina starrii]
MLGQPFTLPGQAPGVAGTRLCHLLADEALLRRLSGNTSEDCVSALRSLNLPDSFWTDEFKVVPCAKTYSHKWTLCPCAHIGETARRRCPRSVNYKAVLCPLVKAKKPCPLGDNCGYAHNVFEHWLHPSRYKTRVSGDRPSSAAEYVQPVGFQMSGDTLLLLVYQLASSIKQKPLLLCHASLNRSRGEPRRHACMRFRLCSFGRNCNRSICFFAHSADELRCVPCTADDKDGDEREYLMQILVAQENGLLPATALDPVPPAPTPPMLQGMMPDLSAAFQQALQQPLPPSARSSVNGIPPDAAAAAAAAAAMMSSARPSMNGVAAVNDVMSSARASMSGCMPSGLQPDAVAAAMFRTSIPGGAQGSPGGGMPAMLRAGRPSMPGVMPDRRAAAAAGFPPARASMNGLPDGHMGFARTRPTASLNGLPPDSIAGTNMLMSMQQHQHQRAVSTEQLMFNAASMQRAVSNDLMATAPGMSGLGMSSPLHTAAAMQHPHALSSDSSSTFNAAAAAMDRALSRELTAAGVGVCSISPVQPSGAPGAAAYHHHALQHQRELVGTTGGSGGGGGSASGPLERIMFGGSRRDMPSLMQAPSMNSDESDSLIHVGGGGGGMGGGMGPASGGAVLSGFGACTPMGFGAALGPPQAPARLSDPGSNFQMAMGVAGGHHIASHNNSRVSDSGNKNGTICGPDLHRLESLLPLVNNALATGALGLSAAAAAAAVGGITDDFCRSNSGGNNSGRGQSPPLQEMQIGGGAGSPSHSGSLTPLSSNSAGEMDGGGPLLMGGMAAGSTRSPGGGAMAPDGAAAAFEYMAAAAAAGGVLPGVANLSAQPMGGVDQTYLKNLVARLQDQGVNKDQLVSSLSQLLAQLLSVS